MEKMVPNLHINSVLPHHSCESTRSSKVRKTEHRPNNFMKNGPEKPINASSGTRWTSGKRAPREQWFLGKKHKAQPQGGQEHAVGKDLSPEVNRASHCFSWKQAVAAEILQGVRKKKQTHSEESSVVEIQRWLVGGVKLAQEHRSPLRVRREPES